MKLYRFEEWGRIHLPPPSNENIIKLSDFGIISYPDIANFEDYKDLKVNLFININTYAQILF